eukprot:TRINITY_DN10644_c0_g1_i7.p1 TRINITY_DN10644_c0_g1~~TRINITY_DN10644_c0_g1_i7.p1  ORF type:complete len:351 (+),score=65.47 TRINITY_DN10644_c0_g1_i7:25-1053(+)
MKKVIIDTDCGTDDAVALLMALTSPSVEVVAITCSYGNCTLENVERNVGSLLDLVGKPQIPYYSGASKPLLGPYIAPTWPGHGTDGFGGVSLLEDFVTPTTKPHPHERAPNAIIRLIKENPGQIHIVTLGPLTNLALAVSLDVSLPSQVASMTSMMGAYAGHGNVGCLAEFNVASDPEAAAIVVEQEWHGNLIMISWCLTNEMALSWNWFDRNIRPPTSSSSSSSSTPFLPADSGRDQSLCLKPLLSVLFALDHVATTKLLLQHIQWFDARPLTSQRLLWLFGLLCRLEKPLDADVSAELRGLLRRLCVLRSQLTQPTDALLPPLNMLITVVTKYFGQRADT